MPKHTKEEFEELKKILYYAMNKLDNLFPLTKKEHKKYENKPKSFFKQYQKVR